MTPSHWAYEIVQAIVDGDAAFAALVTASAAAKWDPARVIEGVTPNGQNLLHLAALYNRPDILCTLLDSSDASIREATEQQRRSVRFESVVTKTTDDAHTRLVTLGKELDKIERVRRQRGAEQRRGRQAGGGINARRERRGAGRSRAGRRRRPPGVRAALTPLPT